MKMIVDGPSSIPVDGKFPFLFYKISAVWNFVILVKDSDTGSSSLLVVRIVIFVCLWVFILRTLSRNYVRWRKEALFC